MTGSTPDAVSEALRRAIVLDASLGHTDWATPPPGAELSKFSAPSGELAVVSLGDPRNPSAVLVPGVTGSKEDFSLMLPMLAEAGYYAQSFDLAGQFESHRAAPRPGEAFTYEFLAADIVAFLESQGSAHLLGYSFAGIVAQLVTVARPELVRSLALLTTPPTSGNVFASMKTLGRIAPFVGPRTGGGLLIWGIKQGFNRPPADRLSFVRERFTLTSRRSVDEIIALMMRAPDMRTELKATGVPMLVASSTRDLWRVEDYERYARQIGAELRIYDTGHSPCETTPHQLSHDLLALYRRAESAGR